MKFMLTHQGIRFVLFHLLATFAVLSRAGENGAWNNTFQINGKVNAIVVRGATVFVGGAFTEVAGLSITNVARWDGTNWFPVGAGAPGGQVDHLAIAGERLIAAFSSGIAAWDGASWEIFPGIPWAKAFALAAQGTNIYAAHGGITPTWGPYILRFAGTNWETLGGGLRGAWNPEVPIPIQSIMPVGNRLYIGGVFYGAVFADTNLTANNLATWDGTNWSNCQGGVIGQSGNGVPVTTMAHSDLGLVVAGNFEQLAVGSPTNVLNVARWDGTNWFTFNGGVALRARTVVAKEREVYVGGDKQYFRPGAVVNGLAKWDGDSWSNFGPVVGTVRALAFRGASLLVGGQFNNVGGSSASNFAVWEPRPSLVIEQIGSNVRIAWPTQHVDFRLESSSDPTGGWTNVSILPRVVNDSFVVSNWLDSPVQFFRLGR